MTADLGRDDAEARRSRLLGIKLVALIDEHVGGAGAGLDARDVAAVPNGVAAIASNGRAWVLVEGRADRALGGALAWAVRRGATSLDLVVDEDAGLLARRATRFSFPVTVWYAEGRTLLPAISEPPTPPRSASPAHLGLRSLIEDGGADPVVEHGVVTGEVRGLEVCRVVGDPAVLEVGVGAHDREAFQMLHGEIPTVEALRDVVAAVAAHRTRDAAHHPLNRLARERFLRWDAERDPHRLGFAEIRAVEPPVPRPGVKEVAPCAAVGRSSDGSLVDVVFSAGVDLDLLPFVADVQVRNDRPVTIALPARDVIPLTETINGLLVRPADIVGFD